MKVHKLKYKQFIEDDLEKVFSFFSNPENLSIITPKRLDFKILSPCPIIMKDNQLIDYTIKILGKKIRWRTMISEYDPPNYFIDQQLLGPYSLWHHKHEFIKMNNGIEVIDTINYVIPFGFLGNFINYIWIKRDLENIFLHRRKVINEYFNNKG